MYYSNIIHEVAQVKRHCKRSAWRRAASVCIASLLLLFPKAYGQTDIISYEEEFASRTLSGVAEDPSGAPMDGVLVENCTSDWKVVLSSTVTNNKGHFAFPKASRGKLHYLRLSVSGFHPIEIKVRLGKSGQKQLKLTLRVAT